MTTSESQAASPGDPVARYAIAALLLANFALMACSGTPNGSPAAADEPARPAASTWTLACTPFPPSNVIPDCARLDHDDRITVRPEVAAMGRDDEGTVPAILIDSEPYFVSKSGTAVRTIWFDNGPDSFSQGLARAIHEGKVGFVNTDLAEVIAPTWDFAFPFQDGYSRVCSGCTIVSDGEHGVVTGGRWGYIDRTGKVAVRVVYPRDDLPPPPGQPGSASD